MSKICFFFFFFNLCKRITTHSSEVQQRLEYWNEVRVQEQQKEGQCSWTTGRREETQKIKSERRIEARLFRSHLGVLNMDRVLEVGSMIWFKQRTIHGNSDIAQRCLTQGVWAWRALSSVAQSTHPEISVPPSFCHLGLYKHVFQCFIQVMIQTQLHRERLKTPAINDNKKI